MATTKEQLWLHEYLTCFSPTEAARRAGYKWPDRTGSRLKAKFAGEIEKVLADKSAQSDEIIARLTEQARNEGSQYINVATGEVDLVEMKKAGKLHLVKAIKRDRWGNQLVEFYDAQAALTWLGKHYKLFTEQTAFEGTVRIEGLDNLLDRIYGSQATQLVFDGKEVVNNYV